MKSLLWILLAAACSNSILAQNVGIGVANPQKGKLEIAGALGNQTTVLTIGSDGTGISLQRNWPTIGLNQYRDANNVQRFIGSGYAGSVFLSQDDGSIVFTQFGQGSANQEITTATYPFVINPIGESIFNGFVVANQGMAIPTQKELRFNGTPKITSLTTGIRNLLPFAYAWVKTDGSKFRGTDNITSFYNQSLGAYILNFTEPNADAIIQATPNNPNPCFATYYRFSSGVVGVYIWNKDGVKIQSDFSVTVMQ